MEIPPLVLGTTQMPLQGMRAKKIGPLTLGANYSGGGFKLETGRCKIKEMGEKTDKHKKLNWKYAFLHVCNSDGVTDAKRWAQEKRCVPGWICCATSRRALFFSTSS